MRVDATKQATPGRTGQTPRGVDSAPVEEAASSRALIALAPPADKREQPGYRQASFLAHLIATKDQFPQTRERRRAEPNEAHAAYRATAALTGH